MDRGLHTNGASEARSIGACVAMDRGAYIQMALAKHWCMHSASVQSMEKMMVWTCGGKLRPVSSPCREHSWSVVPWWTTSNILMNCVILFLGHVAECVDYLEL
jgi:hypothetical protein